MKTTIIIGLMSLATLNGYAQNKECSCKKKTAYHKIYSHKAIVKKTTPKPAYEPCYTYRKHNIVVTQCPDDFSGGYNIESAYTGYYPELESTALTNVNEPVAKTFTLTSPAFSNWGAIPSKYTCEGTKASPPLTIANIPAQAKSLAIIMYDPNAASKDGMTNWLIWNIDTVHNIPENFVSDNESINAAKEWGYQAICPVSGTHYYHFAVYALDTKLLLNRYINKATLERAMNGHVVGESELVGRYNKNLD